SVRPVGIYSHDGCVIRRGGKHYIRQGYLTGNMMVRIIEMSWACNIHVVIGRDVKLDRYHAVSVIGGIDCFAQTTMRRITNTVVQVVCRVDREAPCGNIVIQDGSLSLVIGQGGVYRCGEIHEERLVGLEGRVFAN